jgi:hypothetical protein
MVVGAMSVVSTVAVVLSVVSLDVLFGENTICQQSQMPCPVIGWGALDAKLDIPLSNTLSKATTNVRKNGHQISPNQDQSAKALHRPSRH